MVGGRSMKRLWLRRLLWIAVVMLLLPSCLKQGDTTVLVNDPQEIPFITDYLPEDLLNLFGEENVHFGDQPPLVEMEFKSQHTFVATNLQPPYAPQIGEPSPITYYHKLRQQYLQIADYIGMNSEETHCRLISPAYLMGRGDDFTMYYYEAPQIEGFPEHAVLMSGTLTTGGIKNFRYGYKIMRYNDSVVSPLAYPANSIFIFQDWDGMAESCSWFDDSLFNPQKQ